ncbi:MAG: hypothetical protein AAGC77_09175 [Pseudomonadota bacterium]
MRRSFVGHATAARLVGQHQSGSALILVLWTSLILSALLAGALATARIDARIAAAQLETIKAKQAARSALEIAAFRQSTQGSGGQSAPADLHLNGHTVSLSPTWQSSLIDINLASEAALAAVFRPYLRDPEEAAALAARVMD